MRGNEHITASPFFAVARAARHSARRSARLAALLAAVAGAIAVGAPSAPAAGPGTGVDAYTSKLLGAVVPASTDAVSAGTMLAGGWNWAFAALNHTASPVTNASIHVASSLPALSPPDVTAAAIAPNGSLKQSALNSSYTPAAVFSTGFDSSRSVTPATLAPGTHTITVSVTFTLQDAILPTSLFEIGASGNVLGATATGAHVTAMPAGASDLSVGSLLDVFVYNPVVGVPYTVTGTLDVTNPTFLGAQYKPIVTVRRLVSSTVGAPVHATTTSIPDALLSGSATYAVNETVDWNPIVDLSRGVAYDGLFGPAAVPPPPSLSISGRIFWDHNDNGVYDAGDDLIAGHCVYSDANDNGVQDPGEQQACSNSSGDYTLGGLSPGVYRIRQSFDVNPGATPTTPDPRVIALGPSSVTGADAGYHYLTISGRIFWDHNDNGVYDAGDEAVVGHCVYVDANDNGVLDPLEQTGCSGANGMYSMEGFHPGMTYRIRQSFESNPGGTPTTPDPQVITMGTTHVTGADAGYHYLTISGRIFWDLNGNGVYDPGDPLAIGHCVYSDENDDGAQGQFEPQACATSPNGIYTLEGPHPGETWRIRQSFAPNPTAYPTTPEPRVITMGTSHVTGADAGYAYSVLFDLAPMLVANSQIAPFTFHLTVPGLAPWCSLDGAPYAKCSSPRTYKGLAAGGHTLCIGPYTLGGLAVGEPVCYSWTIVSPGSPNTFIDSYSVSGSNATLWFSSDQPSTKFQCKLDGGPWNSCSTGVIFHGLAGKPGAPVGHTIAVRAVNFANDVDPTPASVSFVTPAP